MVCVGGLGAGNLVVICGNTGAAVFTGGAENVVGCVGGCVGGRVGSCVVSICIGSFGGTRFKILLGGAAGSIGGIGAVTGAGA